jgi:hypothetical protein
MERVSVGRAQCESLLDELEFVMERLKDGVAVSTAQSIADYLRARIYRSTREVLVSVEGS